MEKARTYTNLEPSPLRKHEVNQAEAVGLCEAADQVESQDYSSTVDGEDFLSPRQIASNPLATKCVPNDTQSREACFYRPGEDGSGLEEEET